ASPERLISATGWRRWLIRTWKPVTLRRTRQGLDGLLGFYQKENRLQAKVNLDSMPYDYDTNRATPKLTIDAGPLIEVRTIGDKLAKKKLQRFIPVYEERAVDHDLLVEGARNLRDYYQSEGYFAAEVEFKEQRVTNDKANIDYLVNRGKRHKLVRID